VFLQNANGKTWSQNGDVPASSPAGQKDKKDKVA